MQRRLPAGAEGGEECILPSVFAEFYAVVIESGGRCRHDSRRDGGAAAFKTTPPAPRYIFLKFITSKYDRDQKSSFKFPELPGLF
jgi:hypothetical protein